MKKPIRIHIQDVPVESAHEGSGARQVIFNSGPQFSSQLEAVTKGFLKPGDVFDWHEHDGVDEIWFVLQGKGFIEYEDGTNFKYKEGDAIYNPANVAHKIVAEGEEESQYYFLRINQ